VRARGLALALVLVGLLVPASALAVPPGFFGVVPATPLGPADFERMGDLGIGVRIGVQWPEVEPSPGLFDFSALDRIFGEAADRGVRVLPQLAGSPAWLGGGAERPPVRSAAALAAWRSFVLATAERYGRGGSFWQGRAKSAPPVYWQVWNEPNLKFFWRPKPSAAGYARLLHVSAVAIHAADPRARVLVAGLAPARGEVLPWEFLRALYRVRGFAHDADLIALHPYEVRIGGIEYEVRRMRREMAVAHDGRTGLLVTEFGAASHSEVPSVYDLGLAGQARFLEAAYTLLERNRARWRIAGAYWYTWQDTLEPNPACPFCQGAGLFDDRGVPKPAWRALRRVIARAGVR
jgi:hypothetical protein